MKRTVLLSFSLCAVCALFAQQYKVTEKSSKKPPVWYESVESGYIIASAEAATMEDARQMCMASVKRQIIQSIAENVEFSDSHVIKQTTENDRIAQFLDVYTAEGSTRAASVPFLKGLSLSKVNDFYWEKREDKKTKDVTCYYAIKYPFSSGEHKALIREFELRDKEMEAVVEELEKTIDTVASVEEINQRISKLAPAADYFFDKTRQQWVNTVISNYRKLSNFITVEGVEGENNTYLLTLMLNGKKINTATMPKLTSNCASKLKTSPYQGSVLVSYDNEDCLKDEENSIEAVFRLQGKAIRHKFYIAGN